MVVISKPRNLEVSELFTSIQGEGKFLGKPSIFLRLRRCNLACTNCDERHTWDRTDPDYEKFESFSPEALNYNLKTILTHKGIFNIVITGGEPMLWQREIAEVLSPIPEAYSVEIETNGTITPRVPLLRSQRVHYNVSPKLSTFHDESRVTLRPEAIEWFSQASVISRAIFKFVISRQEDIYEVDAMRNKFKIPFDKIYLMPEGVTREAILEKLPWMFDLCMSRSYNLTPRLHILAFGNQKGT